MPTPSQRGAGAQAASVSPLGAIDTRGGTKQRILVVEDDPHFGQQVVDVLSFHGFDVELAPDGPAGVEAFEARHPDLLLVDLMLPGMGGVEVVRCIRGLPGGARVPTLLMSAVYKNPRLFEKELRDLGILEFLAKPFSLIDMGRRIDAILDAALDLTEEQAHITATGSWRVDQIADALGESSLPFAPVGTFDRRSLANVLVDLFRCHSAGRLLLRRGRSERQIFFLNGYPVWALSDEEKERLGEVLVQLGLIDRPRMQETLARAERDGIMFREALVRDGAIDDVRLFRAERERVRRVVVHSFSWSGGDYEWSDGDEFVDRVGVFEVNPVQCLVEAVGRYLSLNELAPDIEPRSRHEFMEGPRHHELSPYFILPPELSQLTQRFGNGASVADLFRDHPQCQEGLVKALWLMFRLGIADSRPVPARLGVPVEAMLRDPIPPRHDPIDSGGPPAEEEAQVVFEQDDDGDEDDAPQQPVDAATREIVQDYVTLMEADYYRLLRVGREASGEQIAGAVGVLRDRYRPARLGPSAPPEVHRKARELAERVEVASRTLTSADGRAAYDKRLAILDSGDWARPAAFDLLKEARGLVAAERWAEAEPILREVTGRHPRAIEALSMLGRVVHKQASGLEAGMAEARELLRRALAEDPLHLRTLRYFGEVCKDLGDTAGYKLTAATIRTIDPQDPWLLLELARARRGS